MFFRYPDIKDGSLAPEKAEHVHSLAEELPESEIVDTKRRFVTLRTPSGDVIEADVSPSGLTVFLGGFDWVTFPTPQQVLMHYPELMPLPQQVFRTSETDELAVDEEPAG